MEQLEKVLGPLESEVMRAVWDADGAVTVRAVLELLNANRSERLAYTTVMTVMARLAEKGLLERRHQGRGYVYEATVRDAADIAVRGVLRDFGSAAVVHFIEQARAHPTLLRRLEQLLDRGNDA